MRHLVFSLRDAPFTAAFIGICTLLFVAGALSPPAQRAIFLHLAQFNAAISFGEWWRLFTSAFLHSSILHIGFNMYALLVFGPPLERPLGSLAFGMMCMASAAWGGAAAYFLTGPNTILVGASGAIFGVFGVWLYVSYLSRETPMGQEQFRSLMSLLAVNAFLSFAVPRISWQGHAGGLVAGIVVAGAWHRLPRPTTPARRTLVAAAIAVVPVVAVVLRSQ
jgi:membrane associated rhomboid family serine protease